MNQSEGNIINLPKTPIKPGGYHVVQAKFSDSSFMSAGRFGETNYGVRCEQYTYFTINTTTDQIGGGSTKFGIIESDEGFDNQNFMYFFDPDVKTEPGPLDIYTYTLPFVIPMNRVSGTDGWQAGNEPGFMIYTHIRNKGNGIARINNLELVQNNEQIDLSYFGISGCSMFIVFGENYTSGTSIVSQNKISFYFDNPIIPADGTALITCKGWFSSSQFFGKTTEFISINAEYEYTQSFDHQIACYKYETGPGTPTRRFICCDYGQAAFYKWHENYCPPMTSRSDPGNCYCGDTGTWSYTAERGCDAKCTLDRTAGISASDTDCLPYTSGSYDSNTQVCTCTLSS